MRDLSLGESAKKIPCEIGDIILVHSTLDMTMNTTEQMDSPTIDFNDQLSDQFKLWSCGQGKTCVGAKVKVIVLKKDIFHRIALNNMNILPGQVFGNLILLLLID